jgi:3-dehydroquinate dehydratase I
MICVSISEKDVKKCLAMIAKTELAEIRLDLTGFSIAEIKQVFAFHPNLIATSRPGKDLTANKKKLIAAVEAGAAYVDIELEAPEAYRKDIIKAARAHACDVIISYHNYTSTPEIKELNKIMSACYRCGADVAKIAVTAHSPQDCAKVISLYDTDKRVVALAMGDFGKLTRITAPMLGAEFTFAAPDQGKATAPGQIKNDELKKLMQAINNA